MASFNCPGCYRYFFAVVPRCVDQGSDFRYMPDILATLTEIFQESEATQAWSDALAHAWNKPSPFDPQSARIVESYHSSLARLFPLRSSSSG